MIVYLVVFPNNKKYVGITTQSLAQRKRRHLWNAFRGNLKTHFYNALRKYKDQEVWTTIATAETVDQLKFLEQKYISEFDSFSKGYNRTVGGDGMSGYKFSEASKLRMSISRRGVPKSESFKTKMRELKTGVPRTQTTKGKISKTLRDGKAACGARNSKWRGYTVTPHGTFLTIKEAAEHIGCAVTTVFNRCKSEKFKDWYWSQNG